MTRAGFAPRGAEYGSFDEPTAGAVRAFQAQRRLRADGICGPQTWGALAEAVWNIGDRTLSLRSPNMRGDDVADLQRRLGALGFDAGRVDGIYGPDSARAVAEFQGNAGLPVDGICGPHTQRELARLSARSNFDHPVTSVRERMALRPRTLGELRLVLCDLGDAAGVVAIAAGLLRDAGADVTVVPGDDESKVATAANERAVDLVLAVMSTTGRGTVASYQSGAFVSTGGRALAHQVWRLLGAVPGIELTEPLGMTLAILRETKMPAVLCEVGPRAALQGRDHEAATALRGALAAWAAAPDHVPA